MLKQIKEIKGNQRYLLANSYKPLIENAMLYAIKRFDDVTVHGFRTTCGTWCEENGVDKEISKFIKAHQPDYLDAAYQRSDLLEQRREALPTGAVILLQDTAKLARQEAEHEPSDQRLLHY